jgi:hypothetical protein
MKTNTEEKPLHKKILKTLIYNPTFQELADMRGQGHSKQSITPFMNKIPKKDKENMRLKRLSKIKAILEE